MSLEVKENALCIDTFMGKKFSPTNPKAADVCIEDIAHALSLICRYNGHSKFFYSVAQHSIWAAKVLMTLDSSPLVHLYGLLHDALEAYVQDITSPFKKQLPGYKEIERRVQQTILVAFGLPEPTEAIRYIVKEVDKYLLQEEGKILMHGAFYSESVPLIDTPVDIGFEPMQAVEQEFVSLFWNLLEKAQREKVG